MYLKQFKDIEYIGHKRNVQYTRIEIKWPVEINVIGNDIKEIEKFVEKKYDWIKIKRKKIDYLYNEATIVEGHVPYFGKWYSKEKFNKQRNKKKNLREPLRLIAEIHSKKLGDTREIKIKKMITKYASCNKNTIYLSEYLSMLPKELIEYVIFHEYTHLYEKTHNPRFWKIIQKKYKNYEEYERELAIWWNRVRKIRG